MSSARSKRPKDVLRSVSVVAPNSGSVSLCQEPGVLEGLLRWFQREHGQTFILSRSFKQFYCPAYPIVHVQDQKTIVPSSLQLYLEVLYRNLTKSSLSHPWSLFQTPNHRGNAVSNDIVFCLYLTPSVSQENKGSPSGPPIRLHVLPLHVTSLGITTESLNM